MITELELKNFRGFGELTLAPLKQVNLISGKNNTGKTGVLEALFLAFAKPEESHQKMPTLFRSREQNHEDYWLWLLDRRTKNTEFKISAEVNNQRIKIVASQDPQFSTSMEPISHIGGFNIHGTRPYATTLDLRPASISTFPTSADEDAAEFSKLVRKNRRRRAEDLLRLIDERLTDVQLITDQQNRPTIHVGLEGLPDMVPLSFLGQGFGRLLRIYSKILSEDSKIVLIDEIENGIHHSAMRTVWDGLARAASELDVQIFATTHSWECILAAHEAFAARPSYDLSLLRLERHGEEVRSIAVTEEGIATADQFELEVR